MTPCSTMTQDEMLPLGEDIAKEVVGRVLGATTDSTDLARMAILVAQGSVEAVGPADVA